MSARRASALALIVWALLSAGAWAQTFPALTGRVVDQAGVLSPATEASLTQKLAALEARNGAQLVVATVRSLDDYEIRDYGYRLGRAWGIGQAETDNGAILLVAPNDRQVSVEVGYGLEGVLTDAYANRLLDQRVIPEFRAGRMEAGVVAGVDALVEQIALEPGEARARIAAAEAQTASSSDGESGIAALVIGLLILWFVFAAFSSVGRRGRRRGRGGGVAGDIAQVVLWSMLSGGGRGGGGGGWGGGGGGGGGFGGGGGSFGGGGASGSW